jgi:replicative DNA helicase
MREHEESLLGEMLLDNTVYFRTRHTPEHFTTADTRAVFLAIRECLGAGLEANLITIAERCKTVNPGYISHLTSIACGVNQEHYSELITRDFQRRSLIRLGKQVAEDAERREPEQVVETIEKALVDIIVKSGDDRVRKLSELVLPYISLIEERYKAKGSYPGILSGYSDLDGLTLGWQPKMLYYIGGRPSQGKSAILLNFAAHAALKQKKRVGFISLESSDMEIIHRLFSSEGRIDSMRLITGYFDERTFGKISNVGEVLHEAGMYLCDEPNMTALDVRSVARQMSVMYSVEILFVDYVQQIDWTDQSIPRHDQVREVSKMLKAIARELKIPVIAAAQLTRDVQNRRPTLSDFSDSSQIEKDADGAMLIWHHDDITTLLVDKVRDGRTGQLDLKFIKEYVRFESLERHYQEAAS